ncbi:MAG: LrgB family protein [Betaproteobacteria bacterium]|nr:LrgB family protein [Betaproteobacteria bacterium]
MAQNLPIAEIWVYLSGSPLFALIITLGAYWVGAAAYEKSQRHPLANPVLIAMLIVAGALQLTGMSYTRYFEGAQFVHFLLGTATVALAVPIFQGYTALRDYWLALVVALACGALTSVGVAVGVATLLGADHALVAPLYAKSVTAPIAMGVAERIGASPTLTAVFAVVTGILGATLGRFVLDAVGCKAWWQRGFALGTAAHGIGTSRAFSVNVEAGTFASLAMGLHGIVGALAIPMVARAWGAQ